MLLQFLALSFSFPLILQAVSYDDISAYLRVVDTLDVTGGLEGLRSRDREAIEESFLTDLMFLATIHKNDFDDAHTWHEQNQRGWKHEFIARISQEEPCKASIQVCIFKANFWEKLAIENPETKTLLSEWFRLADDENLRLPDYVIKTKLIPAFREEFLIKMMTTIPETVPPVSLPIIRVFPPNPPRLPTIGSLTLDSLPVESRLKILLFFVLGKSKGKFPDGYKKYVQFLLRCKFLKMNLYQAMVNYALNPTRQTVSELIVQISSSSAPFAPEHLILWYRVLSSGKGDIQVSANTREVRMSHETWVELVLKPNIRRLIRSGYEIAFE